MKLRLLILAFIVFSVMCLDLKAVFSRQTTLTEQANDGNLFTIEHFKYNVNSIVEWLDLDTKGE